MQANVSRNIQINLINEAPAVTFCPFSGMNLRPYIPWPTAPRPLQEKSAEKGRAQHRWPQRWPGCLQDRGKDADVRQGWKIAKSSIASATIRTPGVCSNSLFLSQSRSDDCVQISTLSTSETWAFPIQQHTVALASLQEVYYIPPLGDEW